MSNRSVTQVYVESEKIKKEIADTAASLGFKSRSAYFMHLHNLYQNFLMLDDAEKKVLQAICFSSMAVRVTIEEIMEYAKTEKEQTEDILARFCLLGFIGPTKEKARPHYRQIICGEKAYRLTKEGLCAGKEICYILPYWVTVLEEKK